MAKQNYFLYEVESGFSYFGRFADRSAAYEDYLENYREEDDPPMLLSWEDISEFVTHYAQDIADGSLHNEDIEDDEDEDEE